MKNKIIAWVLFTALLTGGFNETLYAQKKKAKHVKTPPARTMKPIKARPVRAPLPPSPPPPPLPPQP